MGKINSEKSTVEYMIGLYCRKKHGSIAVLCPGCEAVRAYAFERLTKCPYGDKKIACKDCKVHCYKEEMRRKIREVMRFSGPRMIIYYPIDFIKHMIKK